MSPEACLRFNRHCHFRQLLYKPYVQVPLFLGSNGINRIDVRKQLRVCLPEHVTYPLPAILESDPNDFQQERALAGGTILATEAVTKESP
jgi:hypothetical protein